MSEKVFSGECSDENLINFSLEVARFYSLGEIPQGMIAIPLSEKRRNRRRFLRCKDNKLTPIKLEEMGVVFPSLKIGFFPVSKVKRVKLVSESGNQIFFTRTNNDGGAFLFELREKTLRSQYRDFLQKIGVDLTEVRP